MHPKRTISDREQEDNNIGDTRSDAPGGFSTEVESPQRKKTRLLARRPPPPPLPQPMSDPDASGKKVQPDTDSDDALWAQFSPFPELSSPQPAVEQAADSDEFAPFHDPSSPTHDTCVALDDDNDAYTEFWADIPSVSTLQADATAPTAPEIVWTGVRGWTEEPNADGSYGQESWTWADESSWGNFKPIELPV